MLTNEAKRQRLITIRNELRSLMGGIALPRHKSVFYTGTRESIEAFCSWLGSRDLAYYGAQNLEQLAPGRYLEGLRFELFDLFGTSDFDELRKFDLGDGTEFSGSINGLWRELSARYAQACSGVVHVLVRHDRVHLHRDSLEYWARSRQDTSLPKDLRVFGFVELPILVGQLSRNGGVTAVQIYVEPERGRYELVQGGQLVMGPGGTA